MARLHPYLTGPLLHIIDLPSHLTDRDVAANFIDLLPFRLTLDPPEIRIQNATTSGTVEFRNPTNAEKALATLTPGSVLLSPFPPPYKDLPTSQDSLPRLIHLNLSPNTQVNNCNGMSKVEIFDMFRPFALRSIRWLEEIPTGGGDQQASAIGLVNVGEGPGFAAVVEFWFEDDARVVESDPPRNPENIPISISIFSPMRRAQPMRAPQSMYTAQPGYPLSPPLSVPLTPSSSGQSIYNQQQMMGGAPAGAPGSPIHTLSQNALPFIPRTPQNVPPQLPSSGSGLYDPSVQAGAGSGAAASAPGGFQPMSPTGMMHGSPPLGTIPLQFGPGQMAQPALTPSGLIDPCNLFCKNLDPSISSNDLFTLFRHFGRIVSARVMRDDSGNSRGFGFVSFQTPQEAGLALQNMNGKLIGTKQITVRLHEPKQLRAEKLASEGRRRSSVGATSALGSPTYSENTDASAVPWGVSTPAHSRRASGMYSVGGVPIPLSPPHSSPQHLETDNWSNLTPERRKGILKEEIDRRVRSMDIVDAGSVDRVVEALVGLDLRIVPALKDEEEMQQKIRDAVTLVGIESLSLLEPKSVPESPSSRTSSPAITEKERIRQAVSKLEPDLALASDISDMISSLKKKDRAMCLFNTDFLKEKVNEARDVIQILSDEGEGEEEKLVPFSKLRAPTEQPARTSSAPVDTTSSSLGPRVSTSVSTPSSPVSPAAKLTPIPPTLRPFNDLMKDSVKDILEYLRVNADDLAEYGAQGGSAHELKKPEQRMVGEVNDFLESIASKGIAQKKQALGERLFKTIKTFDLPRGVKANQIAIALLDSQDLSALAHFMVEFPNALRAKIMTA